MSTLHLRMIMVTVSLWLGIPVAGLACVIDLPTCITPSTGLVATDYNLMSIKGVGVPDAIAVAQENARTDGPVDALLIHCPSRSSVMVVSPGFDGGGMDRPIQIMQDAIETEKTVTFRQVRNSLKAAGFNSVIRPVPADHCACTTGFVPGNTSCPGDG